MLNCQPVTSPFAPPQTIVEHLRDWAQVVLVSIYLGCVFVYLLLTRQIEPHPALQSSFRRYLSLAARRVFNRLLGRGQQGELRHIKHDEERAFVAPIPVRCVSDAEIADVSRIRLFEDGNPLGPPHADHDEIRQLGAGRYSHWFDHVFFSTCDGSDPRENGRRYTFAETE